jgi:DNA-directed RNA polymerase subunit RPC12/RpoP
MLPRHKKSNLSIAHAGLWRDLKRFDRIIGKRRLTPAEQQHFEDSREGAHLIDACLHVDARVLSADIPQSNEARQAQLEFRCLHCGNTVLAWPDEGDPDEVTCGNCKQNLGKASVLEELGNWLVIDLDRRSGNVVGPFTSGAAVAAALRAHLALSDD